MNSRSRALAISRARRVDGRAIARNELRHAIGNLPPLLRVEKVERQTSSPRSLNARAKRDHERMLLRRAGAVREDERRGAARHGLRSIKQGSRALTRRDVYVDLSRLRIAPSHRIAFAPELSAVIAAREAVEKIHDRRKSFGLEKHEAAQLRDGGFLCFREDAAGDDQHWNLTELRNLAEIGRARRSPCVRTAAACRASPR